MNSMHGIALGLAALALSGCAMDVLCPRNYRYDHDRRLCIVIDPTLLDAGPPPAPPPVDAGPRPDGGPAGDAGASDASAGDGGSDARSDAGVDAGP